MKKLISAMLVVSLVLSLCIAFTACGSSSNSDKFVGSWVEVLDPTRVTTITKDDKGLTWKDPEGTYPTEFKNGKLIVNAGDITAKVTYNEKDDSITAEYENSKTTYNRKETN